MYVPAALTVGWAIVDELNPVPGLQLYDRLDIAVVPMEAEEVIQLIDLSKPASAVGAVKSALTVT